MKHIGLFLAECLFTNSTFVAKLKKFCLITKRKIVSNLIILKITCQKRKAVSIFFCYKTSLMKISPKNKILLNFSNCGDDLWTPCSLAPNCVLHNASRFSFVSEYLVKNPNKTYKSSLFGSSLPA